jgi:hypothetical protein
LAFSVARLPELAAHLPLGHGGRHQGEMGMAGWVDDRDVQPLVRVPGDDSLPDDCAPAAGLRLKDGQADRRWLRLRQQSSVTTPPA